MPKGVKGKQGKILHGPATVIGTYLSVERSALKSLQATEDPSSGRLNRRAVSQETCLDLISVVGRRQPSGIEAGDIRNYQPWPF